jgi:PAS domain S-box-containing protein
MQELGANASSFALFTSDRNELATAYCQGYAAEIVERYKKYSVDTALPNAAAARSGQPLYIETVEERDTLYPHLCTHKTKRGAIAAIPLLVDDVVLGAMSLSFAEDRPFPESDKVFMQTIIQVCAQAAARQREIDQRKYTERILVESERCKAAILQAALDCVITIDEQGCVVDWNPAAERTFGYSRIEAVGSLLSELIIPEQFQEMHNEGIARYLRTGEGPLLFRRVEVTGVRRDGHEVPIELTILPIRLADRTLFTAYARDISDRLEMIGAQKTFMRDILFAVTEGKLRLCSKPEDLPTLGRPICDPIPLSRTSGIPELRHTVQQIASETGFAKHSVDGIATATSEAAMNAVLHAGGGFGQVFVDDASIVQVKVSDTGTGILLENLPNAALRRGYSTSATLGHGLKMIIETADEVNLLTGPGGTTVILEQNRDQPLPGWLGSAPGYSRDIIY